MLRGIAPDLGPGNAAAVADQLRRPKATSGAMGGLERRLAPGNPETDVFRRLLRTGTEARFHARPVRHYYGSPDVSVGHFRPGSSRLSPPRVSMAMAMRASGEW